MSQIENKAIFEDMPIPKAAKKLMVPTVLSSLVMVIYSLADTYFVGRLNDPLQNAAVTLAAPVMLSFNAVSNLFGVGSSSMMSRALGRKDFDTVRKSAAFGFYCSLAGGLFISMLCLFCRTPILHLLGADAASMDATAAYMKWTVICGAAPSILNVVMAYFVRSEGAAFHASIGTMSGCILNMILDPIFIMPWGLGMGAAGAGLATFLSNCTACGYFFVLLYVKKGRTFISVKPKDFTLKREIVTGICGVGVPASIQNLLNVTGMTILNNLMSGYGTEAVAAIGIAQKIYMIPMQIALGGTQGIMPLVGYSYSSGNYRRMDDTIRFVRRLLIPCLAAVAAFGWIYAAGLIRIFISNPEIVRYGAIFLRALSLCIVFLVIDFLGIGVFQSVGKGRISLVFAILRKIVFEIPATLILNGMFGIYGIAYGAFAAELMLAGISTMILNRMMKGLRGMSHPD